MKSETLAISGMSCSGCVAHVTRALNSSPGTSNVRVDLEAGKAFLDYDPSFVTLEELIAAVDEEGYTATPDKG